jgi:hypothetical protein
MLTSTAALGQLRKWYRSRVMIPMVNKLDPDFCSRFGGELGRVQGGKISPKSAAPQGSIRTQVGTRLRCRLELSLFVVEWNLSSRSVY